MELHNTSLCYAFPYQNMEFHITKILKEIIAGKSSKTSITRFIILCEYCNMVTQRRLKFNFNILMLRKKMHTYILQQLNMKLKKNA